ncbi:MAG: 50S ribosomal protein L6, partial [Cytophagales bacterium]
MSRIGKLPIELPKGVTCTFSTTDNQVTVKGPKGELKQVVEPSFKIIIEGNLITVERPTEQKRHKAMHGLYRSLINNMVQGVSTGYKTQLEVIGVGYKATAQGNLLDLSLGYSHSIIFAVPSE